MLYDALLLFGVLFVAAIPLAALDDATRSMPSVHLAIQIYLAAVIGAYFAGFWSHGGQTLGMRAWRLRLVAVDGRRLSHGRMAVRLLAAALSWIPVGAGYLWILFDGRRAALHDRLCGTAVVHEKA